MSLIGTAAQIAIALGIFNVWIIRRNRATPYRPEGAANIAEEFERYGLPAWARVAVGSTKIVLAAALLVGVVFAQVAAPAAALLAILMAGAIAAHIRVRDPLVKAVPAFAMLVLCAIVVLTHSG